MGVYRLVDSYNDRPVFKQDMGENYIYYRYKRLSNSAPYVNPFGVNYPATTKFNLDKIKKY